MKSHSTDVAGMSVTKGADHRYIGNVFTRGGLKGYERFPQPILVRDNVYAGTALPLPGKEGARTVPGDIALRTGRIGVSGRGAAWDRIRGLMEGVGNSAPMRVFIQVSEQWFRFKPMHSITSRTGQKIARDSSSTVRRDAG